MGEKYRVKAKQVAYLMEEAKYLEELARKTLENPADGEFVVESEYEKLVIEGKYVGRALAPDTDQARVMRPGGGFGNCKPG